MKVDLDSWPGELTGTLKSSFLEVMCIYQDPPDQLMKEKILFCQSTQVLPCLTHSWFQSRNVASGAPSVLQSPSGQETNVETRSRISEMKDWIHICLTGVDRRTEPREKLDGLLLETA